VSFRRAAPTVTAAAVLAAVADAFAVKSEALRRRQYDCVARAAAAFLLGRHAGMNQRDIGAFLGMGTGSAVCRQLQRLRERRIHDTVLQEQMARAEYAIDEAARRQASPGISIVKG
jgi:chromosomal replication initiation ATPase DnaA